MNENEVDFLLVLCPEQATFVRLIRLANACGRHPIAVAISLLRDVLEDDECAHEMEAMPRTDERLN